MMGIAHTETQQKMKENIESGLNDLILLGPIVQISLQSISKYKTK